MIGAPQQHQKDTNQVQHFAFRNGQGTLERQALMNLRDGPTFPKTPVPNLYNHLQRKAPPAQCQPFGCGRGVHTSLLRVSTVRVRTVITDANDQCAPAQKDHVFTPPRVSACEHLTAAWAMAALWPIVMLWNSLIIFGVSHLSPFRHSIQLSVDCT